MIGDSIVLLESKKTMALKIIYTSLVEELVHMFPIFPFPLENCTIIDPFIDPYTC
jgi:hypothetical protein